MPAIEKTKHAIYVAEKCGFESIISIYATQFEHIPAGIHLSNVNELTGYDCQVADHTESTREVFAMVDGVKVYVVMQIEECVAS